MSYPSQGYGAPYGYDQSQYQEQASQGRGYSRQMQNPPGVGRAHERVDASQYCQPLPIPHIQPRPHPQPQPQPQYQSWQQNNSFQQQFYSAQTSPNYSQGIGPVYGHVPQPHAHPAQQMWLQVPAPNIIYQQSQPPLSGRQTTSYSPIAFTQSLSAESFQGQRNPSFAQPNKPYLTSYDRHPSIGSVQPTHLSYQTSHTNGMAPTETGQKSLLQPQSVNQQSKPAQLQASKHPHLPHIQLQKPQQQSPMVQDQIHPPKRRKSNEGTALPSQPVPAHPPHVKTKGRPSQSSSLADLSSSQAPPPTQKDSFDLSTMLLTLAEEYIAVARSMASGGSETQYYQQLIATAITCLESALLNFRQLDVRRESFIRIKLAALIFEETETTDYAEEILSKGIAICERARLPDLRYTMQHLHIRILHSKVPKAAIKTADKMIAEVQVLGLVHWSFAFRFLKFSLSSGDTSADYVALLRQLTQINELTKRYNNVPLGCLTSCLEAMVSLRTGTTDGLEVAQRSLAEVRSYQLNPELNKLPQLKAMISHLDIACHITSFSADQMKSALQVMQSEQDIASKAKGWRDDGSYTVSLGTKAQERLVLDTPGVFAENEAGEFGLSFDWLTKGAMLTIGYVLSGIALLPRNGETRKSEMFFKEALKINDTETTSKGSIKEVRDKEEHQRATRAAIKFIMACTFAARARYGDAVTLLKEVNQEKTQHLGSTADVDCARLKFLTAVCLQGSGELRKAHELYATWHQEFDAEKKVVPILRDVQTLAILNSVHIMRLISPQQTSRMETLLQSIETYCLAHPNKAFASVYHVVQSTIAPADTTIGTIKKTLNLALVPAQTVKNKQLLALIMNMMSETFFTDLVGAQAKSSSNAGRTLAKQNGDELWVAVGSGMLRDTLERSGQLDEAIDANDQAQKAVNSLPRAVKASLALG